MRSTFEELEGNKVKLSVEVDEGEFDKALDAAFRKLARQTRIPGFRPGKAPRRLLEARLGSEVAREEALRDSLPDYYEQAVKEHQVEPIAPPEIDITSGRDEGPVVFDAVVEVMPRVRVGGYEGLRVVLPSLEVTDEEVDAQVDRLRDQFGELRAVPRPARPGDHVSIDRRVYRHDETLQVAEDELYEVGKGTMGPELDQQLEGARAGDILKFNTTIEGEGEVSFQVLVKEVREKVLPEVTDEWAGEASEFDTVAELREDIRRRSDAVKRLQAALMVREKVAEALVELVAEDMPEALVAGEVQRRGQMLEHRLSHRGATLEQYLEATGKSPEELYGDLQEEAVHAIKADLAIRFVAEEEGIEVTEEDVDQEIAEMAQRQGERPDALRRRLDREGRLPAVRSEISKAKALEWLIEHTEYVDEDGRVIERPELEPPRAEGPGPSEAASTPASPGPERTDSEQETTE